VEQNFGGPLGTLIAGLGMGAYYLGLTWINILLGIVLLHHPDDLDSGRSGEEAIAGLSTPRRVSRPSLCFGRAALQRRPAFFHPRDENAKSAVFLLNDVLLRVGLGENVETVDSQVIWEIQIDNVGKWL